MTLELPKYLLKRGSNFAVRFSVPKEYQTVTGRKEVVRSLGTSDLYEALGKRDAVLKQIEGELKDQLGGRPTAPMVNPEKLEGSTVRVTFHRWLSQADGINNKTRQRYRQHLEAFEAFTGDIEVSEINRSLALRFMDHLKSTPSERTGEKLSERSLQSYQSCLASYWRVLDHWGLVDPDARNPFSSLLRRLAGQRKQKDPRAKSLRPVIREEAEALLSRIAGNDRLKYHREMYVIVRLLWVTACRLNELCSRSLDDIDDRGDHIRINIPQSKTDAGKRVVMVVGQGDCELLRDAMKRAKVDVPSCPDNEGMLFPRLALGGYDRKASHYIGKSLEAVRKTIPTHAEWDMHSFRRTGVSALVNAGVAKEARNLAVGHSNKDDIGMSVYAKRGDLSEVIKATFDALYEELGGSLQ
ncbi:tyrosine-type recombinase/integrase [Roseovarius pacificus]|uniref:tyrosine-type recombinase/integrase n=1 Tax=Roseovarius pacificus TaxID=337701 RepID=UPI004039E71B